MSDEILTNFTPSSKVFPSFKHTNTVQTLLQNKSTRLSNINERDKFNFSNNRLFMRKNNEKRP